MMMIIRLLQLTLITTVTLNLCLSPTSFRAYASTSGTGSTTINGTLHYSVSPTQDYDYELMLSGISSTTSNNDPWIQFLWKSEFIPSHDAHGHGHGHGRSKHHRHGNHNDDDQYKRKKYSCRIIHKVTNTGNNKPSWIGFGVQDIHKLQNKNNDVNELTKEDKMIGADAIIGFTNNGNDDSVRRYALNGFYEGNGGVEEKPYDDYDPDSIYDLYESKVFQIESEGNGSDSEETITTIFDFVIIVDDDDDDNEGGITRHGVHSETSTNFHIKGENLFIFAIGPSSLPSSSNNFNIGKHVKAGSFLIDFDKVGTSIERSYISSTSSSSNNNNCQSDDTNYEYMMMLQNNIKFYWTLDTINDQLNVQMKHLGHAWLGWGIANDAEGQMIGSNAIIGRPALTAADGERPLKYFLSKKESSGIYPMAQAQQTLIDANVKQSEEETTLQFTKLLDETNENVISKTNMTTILVAVGEGNILSKHVFADSFSLKLGSCPLEVNEVVDDDVYKTAWIFHGIFGTMAFALFVPISVSSAFLRQLFPTSWIFLHAYGNLLTLAFALIAVFIAITTFSSSGDAHFTETHHKIGLSLLILVSVQVINGMFRPNHFEDTRRKLWKLFHRVSGVTILTLGLYQVGDGLNMFSEDYDTMNLAPFYFVLLVVFVVVVMGARLWLYVNGGEERKFGDNVGDDLHMETERLDQIDPAETELT